MQEVFNKFMQRNFYTIILGMMLAFLSAASLVFAQSEKMKQATEDVKQSTDALITIRDESITDDLVLRIETFKKVVGLSITEAKDLKVKLLFIEDKDQNIRQWRDDVVQRLGEVLQYFEVQTSMALSNVKTVEDVKNLAQTFKEWRELKYVPLTDEINDFLILKKGEEILKIANTRIVKINKDISKLEKTNPKTAMLLRNLLQKAMGYIEESEKIKREVGFVFEKMYIEPLLTVATSSATSSLIDDVFSTSTTIATSSIQETSPTSSLSIIGNDDLLENNIQLESIKDLVRISLQKVKEAYRIFIEMSSLVRELP